MSAYAGTGLNQPSALSMCHEPGAPPGAARAAPEPIAFRRVPELPYLELILASETDHLFRVFHETFTICVVSDSARNRSSSGQWWYRGRDHTVSADSLMLMEPGECHVTKSIVGRPDFRVLFLAPSWVEELARELGHASTPHWRVAQIQSVPGLVDAFQQFLFSLDVDETPLVRETRLLEALRRAFYCCAETRPRLLDREGAHSLRLARDYLHAHVGDAVSLDDLVEVSRMSRFHLIRSFKKVYGLAPHAYHTQLRIAAARKQLEAGWRPSELDVGFYDQSHLNRNFRRSLGVTPHGYRSAIAPARHRPVDWSAPFERPPYKGDV